MTTRRHILSSFPAGTVLNQRYEITGFIGAGGFATVYEARCIHTEREVAIKVLDMPRRKDEDSLRAVEERFAREASVMMSLEHEVVVDVYDHGVLDEPARSYLVMERLEGRNLEVELRDHGSMAPTRAFRLVKRCLEALQEGHSRGIVHRDLKPSNLFLVHPETEDEDVRILDYGVASIEFGEEGRLTHTGQLVGTYQYLSPEYIRSRTVTPSMDVYQMGLILVEMLTGVPVIQDENHYVVFTRHVENRLRIPVGLLRSELGAVLAKALCPEFHFRYPNAQAFLKALENIDPRKIPKVGPTDESSLLCDVSSTDMVCFAMEASPRVFDTGDLVAIREEDLDDPVELPVTTSIPDPVAHAPSEPPRKTIRTALVWGFVVVASLALGWWSSNAFLSQTLATSRVESSPQATKTPVAPAPVPKPAERIEVLVSVSPKAAKIHEKGLQIATGEARVWFESAESAPRTFLFQHKGYISHSLTIGPGQASVEVNLLKSPDAADNPSKISPVKRRARPETPRKTEKPVPKRSPKTRIQLPE